MTTAMRRPANRNRPAIRPAGRVMFAAAALALGFADGNRTGRAAAETRSVPRSEAEITLSFASVARKAAPAVVNIYARTRADRPVGPFFGDPFFDRFFGDMFAQPRTRRRIENSLGSGVIVDPAGIVVSNHHVVAGAEEITVVLGDRREFRGTVIFEDPESDLAAVRLSGASGLPALALRDSGTLEVGDLVLAIGNPFGVGQTVTSGIVSGVSRSGVGELGGGGGLFIQTDAAINPGNSGGALVDMNGRLVGVNTSIVSSSGGSQGIGFAVPANLVARAIAEIRQGRSRMERPWLGIEVQPVDAGLASALGMDRPLGVIVTDLHPEGVLGAAGLMRRDVLLDIDGEAVNTLQEVDYRVSTRLLGTHAEVRFLRDGRPETATVLLAPAPESPPRDERVLASGDALPGLRIVNINPAVIDDFDLPVRARGVLVLAVRGAARRVGLRRGDIIREIDGRAAATVGDVVEFLRVSGGTTEIGISRGGRAGSVRYRS